MELLVKVFANIASDIFVNSSFVVVALKVLGSKKIMQAIARSQV